MKQLIFAAMILIWASTALPVSAQVASPPPTIEEVSAMASPVNTGAGWTPPGSSSKPEPTMSGRILLTPTPAGAAVIEIAGKKTSWGALTQQEMRGALDVQDENVKVEQYDLSGHLTSLPINASFKKGRYRVTYYYYRYRNNTCKPNDPTSGGVAIGTGIRVTAEINTLKNGVAITGLLPLSAAAESNRVKGSIRVEAIGIASGTSSITSYLSGTSSVTAEGIQKAVESFGVVKAVSETPNVTLSPNYLFVESPDIAECLKSLKPVQ